MCARQNMASQTTYLTPLEKSIFKKLPLGCEEFTLSEVYRRCNSISPPSIRHYLQVLRNKNLLNFIERGCYSLTERGLIELRRFINPEENEDSNSNELNIRGKPVLHFILNNIVRKRLNIWKMNVLNENNTIRAVPIFHFMLLNLLRRHIVVWEENVMNDTISEVEISESTFYNNPLYR